VSTLTLVRHGQARPFEKNSDLLSDLGELQARAIGDYWCCHGIEFHEVVSGTLTRQLQTTEYAGLTTSRIDPGWNEYDAGSIIQILAPKLALADEAFATRQREWETLGHGPDKNRYFQRMFESLMDAWLTGRIAADGVETFAAYRARVINALQTITNAEGSNRNILVITSGGPIGLCVQNTLQSPDAMFLDVNWRIRNCSMTEFTFSRGRVSLDTFNTLGHLDRQLWTWR
jgi:broad specificity phosphatase PhoE